MQVRPEGIVYFSQVFDIFCCFFCKENRCGVINDKYQICVKVLNYVVSIVDLRKCNSIEPEMLLSLQMLHLFRNWSSITIL